MERQSFRCGADGLFYFFFPGLPTNDDSQSDWRINYRPQRGSVAVFFSTFLSCFLQLERRHVELVEFFLGGGGVMERFSDFPHFSLFLLRSRGDFQTKTKELCFPDLPRLDAMTEKGKTTTTTTATTIKGFRGQK